MKILVLENDPKEFALIQQALDDYKTSLVPLVSSELAWSHIQTGEARLVIANWDTSDLRHMQFLPRVRAMKLDPPLYILLTTSKSVNDKLIPTEVDDIIHKPFNAHDLKIRVGMAVRIISLAGNLASARVQLENKVVYDRLTGLMNNAGFLRQSKGELERARRGFLPLSLIALNIDNIKTINEKYGVESGEEALRVVARFMREKSRPYDCLGRWAEDTFLILLSNVIGTDAEKVADRIIAGMRGTRIEVENEAPLSLKISAGIASVTRVATSTEVESLIQQAIQAMTRAKEAGDNQVFLIYI